jgi:hypothetical protein
MPAKRQAKAPPESKVAESRLSLVEHDTNTCPVVIRDVRYRGRTFRFRNGKYTEFLPTYDETGELLCLEHEPIGIHVFADTREELLAELAEQVCMLWDEYACEDDEKLTPAAIQLKKKLLDALEEV